MSIDSDWGKIAERITDRQVLALEQAAIRIPSTTFEEGPLADHLANYMADAGLDVEMMDVTHPAKPGMRTRQPIGRLRGTGGGPSLMLNGHMDPGVEMSGWTVDPYGAKFDDGWVWGMGAHDDKGGVVAAICGVEAIVRAGVRLGGDVLVCPVVAHKLGGAGTRALLAHGVRADLAINMEHSALTIANVCVGIVMVRIRTRSPELFFRYSPEARAAYMNPIEQQCRILERIGPSLDPIPPGGWLTFTPHPDLPGFPTHTFDTIHKEHYYQPNHTGLSSRECEMIFQIRTVPGQTVASVRADLHRMLEALRKEHPALDYEVTIPAPGSEEGWCQDPMETPRDHPLVRALAAGHALASGAEAVVGAWGRLGNVGDGNIIQAAGIPSVQYGAGDIRTYKEWPTPDERVRLDDLVIAARAVAHATQRLCA
ncbi:MAG TPA: M20 family metallopeptidase [Candidatus Binatia bacterium]|nr:M20 family metallopeptidase [Candidatus Binatia bacterium]